MKIKGISFIEQHVEKVVLGIAVAALVGVGVWQFGLRSNRVTMGGRDVEPGEVDRRLVERASELADRLRDDATIESPALDRPPAAAAKEFAASLTESVSRDARLARLSPALGGRLLPIDLGADTWYYQPRPAAPIVLVDVVQTADALDDVVVAQYPELAARFQDGRPKDIVWTTPAATIDPQALIEELRRSQTSATPPKAAVPTPWYNDMVMIVDVVFEREELGPDGTWRNRVEVAPIPGQLTYRPQITAGADATLSRELLASLGDVVVQQQILQPDFLPTRNNAFIPPTLPTSASQGTGNEAADEMLDVLGRMRDELTRTQTELQGLGGPIVDEPAGGPAAPPRDGEREGGAGGGGGLAPPSGGGLSGGFSGQKGGGGKSSADTDRDRKRRELLTRQLRRLTDRVSRLEAEIRAIAPELLIERTDEATGLIDLKGDEPVLVWAHDIGVEPGGTYRYRVMSRLFNPFFARSRQLVKEQEALAESIAMPSAWSDWSSPVDVTPPVAFFVTRASPGEGPLGAGVARFEIFRLHDGKWRRDEFSGSPGDRVGRAIDSARGGLPPDPGAASTTPVRIDFGTEWYVVDIVEDLAAERRTQGDFQRSGIVVLQRADGKRIEIREPQRDLESEARRRLNRDWRVGSLS